MSLAVSRDNQSQKRIPNALEQLASLVGEDLARVNAVIIERMQSDVSLIPQLAGHIVAAGGKRLRPMLTLASARMCGYEGRRHLALAACVEFIHTATLLHDDVVDASGLRRGLATANALWGNKSSVLVGDFLFSRSFQLMVADGSLRILKILSDAAAEIAEGEVHQLMTANDTTTSEAKYLEVIRAKTATLFGAACRIGAVVAERPQAEELALAEFGFNLGIAYQLVDDVLDYAAQGTLGKSVGDDFREGKVTLPAILAFARGDEAERAFWKRTLEDVEQRDGDLERAIALTAKHGAVAETIERARLYGAKARAALAPFRDGIEKRILVDSELWEIASSLKSVPGELSSKLERLLERQKELERELSSFHDKVSHQELSNLLPLVRKIKGVNVLSAKVDGKDVSRMREFVDQLKGKMGSGIILLGGQNQNKVSLIMGVTSDLTQRFHAGELIKKIAVHVGGTGGGRPDFAQAGGTDSKRLDEALKAIEDLI